MAYIALIGCENGAGQRFEPGDSVPAAAFPPEVIENWLAIGVLKPNPAGMAVKRRKAKSGVEEGEA